MSLKIYNTLTKKKEEFKPLKDNKVGMYVCGPTVYDEAHIGHARPYISFDIVKRHLTNSGFVVKYVRNITDVDDKIIKKANQEKVDYREISKRFAASFRKDMHDLGLLNPDIEPLASEHINEMLAIVSKLVEKGFAYESSGDVYFSVDKFSDYTKLSKRNLDDMEAGARVDVSSVKRNAFDFALWKKAKEGEPSWDSPWGKGRPGWHIECSAMSSKYLGETFDIHGGGRDLIFPHHENEIAQSEAYTGKAFAKYWIHNGFVNIDKEKMSKSLGNFITIKEILSKFSADAFKLFMMSTHYRSPIDFSDNLIDESEKAVERVYTLYREAKNIKNDSTQPISEIFDEFKGKFIEAMDDDFNTAKALGLFFDYVTKGFKILDNLNKDKKKEELTSILLSLNWASDYLGIFEHKSSPETYFHRSKDDSSDEKIKEIEALVAERKFHRANKEWAKADEVRDLLMKKYGVQVDDKKEGVSWKFVK